MKIELCESEIVSFLIIGEEDSYSLQKNFTSYTQNVELLQTDKAFQQISNIKNRYDIVFIYYDNETSMELVRQIHDKDHDQVVILFLDSNDIKHIKEAVLLHIDALILTPWKSYQDDFYDPITKLIDLKQSQKDLYLSQHILKQKNNLIDK